MVKVDGQWHEVSWDEAFRRCTELLAPIIERHGIGAVTCYTGNPLAHSFSLGRYTGILLGMSGIPSVRIETGSSTGAAVFQAGWHSIASGRYGRVLVIGAEKMTHVPSVRATGILAEVLDPYERGCGCTMTALAAMVTRRYMHDFGMTEEELALVSVKNHRNGSLNPYAQFRKPVSLETVMDSGMDQSPCLTCGFINTVKKKE